MVSNNFIQSNFNISYCREHSQKGTSMRIFTHSKCSYIQFSVKTQTWIPWKWKIILLSSSFGLDRGIFSLVIYFLPRAKGQKSFSSHWKVWWVWNTLNLSICVPEKTAWKYCFNYFLQVQTFVKVTFFFFFLKFTILGGERKISVIAPSRILSIFFFNCWLVIYLRLKIIFHFNNIL